MWSHISLLFINFLVIAEQANPEDITFLLHSKISGNVFTLAFRKGPSRKEFTKDFPPTVSPSQHDEKTVQIGSTGARSSHGETKSYREKRSTRHSMDNAYKYLDMQLVRFGNCYIKQTFKEPSRRFYWSWRRVPGTKEMKNDGYKNRKDCIGILQETLKASEIAKLPEGTGFVLNSLIEAAKNGETKMKDPITGRRTVNNMFRIYRGRKAPDGKYHYVAIMTTNNGVLCGATILNKRWLLTAGYCMEKNPDVSGWRIVVGTNKRDGSGGDNYTVERAFRHPSYEKIYYGKNDIGLIRVKKDIIFGSKVQPVTLPNGQCPQNYTGKGVMIGWGLTGPSTTPEKLNYLDVDLISKERCQSFNPSYNLSGDHICTLPKPREGQCYGDPGGPLLYHGVQIGVVSGSLSSCGEGLPTIYTDVCTSIPWINKNINK